MHMNIIVRYRWAFLSFLHVQRHLYSVKVQLYPLLGTDDCNLELKVLIHIPHLLFRFDALFGWKTCALICNSLWEKGKCEGKKIQSLIKGPLTLKKIQNHTSWFCSDPSFSFQGIFCNFNQFENFALHGENWKMKILKIHISHQIKRVSYCKWNFKGFKILTNFKAWANLIPFDFWKWKKSLFMKSDLLFWYNAPLRFKGELAR